MRRKPRARRAETGKCDAGSNSPPTIRALFLRGPPGGGQGGSRHTAIQPSLAMRLSLRIAGMTGHPYWVSFNWLMLLAMVRKAVAISSPCASK